MKNKLLKIKKTALFSFSECLWFLDRNLNDCMHELIDGKIRKAIRIDKDVVLVEVYEAKEDIVIKIIKGNLKNEAALIHYIEDWLDINRDIQPFYKLLKKDSELSHLAKHYKGLRAIGIPELFEALCWSIIGQQINLTFAHKLKRRLSEKYGEHIRFETKTYYLFPEAGTLKNASLDELKALQFSGRKAEYIIGIAELFSNGSVSKEKIAALGNEIAMFNYLKTIRGVGEWTAHYVLMKSLRNMNSITYGDAGLNNALFKIKGIARKNNREEIDKLFKNFEGWKAYLVCYLWRSLS